jgi:hypothetical protein
MEAKQSKGAAGWRVGDAGYTVFGPKVEGRVSPETIARVNKPQYAPLIAASPAMFAVLVQAVEASGFSVSGPTDSRAAEHGEPAWVCNARAALALARAPSARGEG